MAWILASLSDPVFHNLSVYAQVPISCGGVALLICGKPVPVSQATASLSDSFPHNLSADAQVPRYPMRECCFVYLLGAFTCCSGTSESVRSCLL